MIVIKGGNVLTANGWQESDVTIDGGLVHGVGQALVGDVVLDASGCLVGPGFVDLHTHLREPGHTWKEDIESGSRSAVAGGYTAIVAMPNTEPAQDRLGTIRQVAARGSDVGLLDVIPAACLTVSRAGDEITDLEGLYDGGVRLFTDDGDSLSDPGLMFDAMKRLAQLEGAVLAQHAEDTGMTDGGSMHLGAVSERLGVAGWPSEAESEVVARDLDLVADSGVSYHCQHVSSEQTLGLIREAKRDRLPVTAEVTPHHLVLDETNLSSLDTNLKMYPPLRGIYDREALVDGLGDGTIDLVATDHAPHTIDEKEVPFEKAPRGVIGLETAAAVVWGAYRSPQLLFDRLSTAAARLVGLSDHGTRVAPGVVANLVVFDPEVEWIPTGFASKSSNSPFLRSPLRGRVKATLFGGKIVFENGAVE